MSATLAGFGLRPVYHPSGIDRASVYTIASAYGSAIYKGSPCTLNTNGTITVAAAAADFLGAFAGVEYVDATGKPTYSNYWPASTTATAITAYVYDDPNVVYEIQCDGSVAQTAIGDQADFTSATVASGSTSTGISSSTMSASLAGAAAQGQLRIVGFGLAPDNAVGDAYTVVRVTNARSQFVYNKVAI